MRLKEKYNRSAFAVARDVESGKLYLLGDGRSVLTAKSAKSLNKILNKMYLPLFKNKNAIDAVVNLISTTEIHICMMSDDAMNDGRFEKLVVLAPGEDVKKPEEYQFVDSPSKVPGIELLGGMATAFYLSGQKYFFPGIK